MIYKIVLENEEVKILEINKTSTLSKYNSMGLGPGFEDDFWIDEDDIKFFFDDDDFSKDYFDR